MGDGITERFQLIIGALQLRRPFSDTLLQFRIEITYFVLRMFALGDVADVALNHVTIAGLIYIAHKFHGNVTAILRFQRHVFITDTAMLLQLLELCLVGRDVLGRPKIPDGFSNQFSAGKTEEFAEKGVHIVDTSSINIQNQDAVPRRFE